MPHNSRLLPNFEHKKIGRKRKLIRGLDFCALSPVLPRNDGRFFICLSPIQREKRTGSIQNVDSA